MPFVDTRDGVRIHLRDVGAGHPVVPPPFAGTVDMWNYQIGRLAQRHRVVAVDAQVDAPQRLGEVLDTFSAGEPIL